MVRAPLEPSLWYATAAPAPETSALQGTVNADVCVVGACYTGLSTALHLAEQGVGTIVLEAEQIGFGGSGRNAGHCTPTFHFYDFPKVRRMLGEPYAERLIRRQTNAANLVFDLIRRYEIDCDGMQNGYVQPRHRRLSADFRGRPLAQLHHPQCSRTGDAAALQQPAQGDRAGEQHGCRDPRRSDDLQIQQGRSPRDLGLRRGATRQRSRLYQGAHRDEAQMDPAATGRDRLAILLVRRCRYAAANHSAAL